MQDSRTESDSLGTIEVPGYAYWGAQTQRSLRHFSFPAHHRMPILIVHALATVKLAASRVNRRHGLDPRLADAIEQVAEMVRKGAYDNQFPLTIFQTGSGTQTNMNLNEVIAGIANERLAGVRGGKQPVHPNDHVNMSQSSNDSFPTALHIAALIASRRDLLSAIDVLYAAIDRKAQAFADIVKIGRTHLQDATPLTLGQEFSGYAAQIASCRERIVVSLEKDITVMAAGGTAVGTGLNAPDSWRSEIVAELSKIVGVELRPATNSFEQLAAKDGLVSFSGALNTLAVALNKIANDLRLLASGPRSGLAELSLPANEPGSSTCPAKSIRLMLRC